ncbi:MAG: hypothetical protein R3Y39_07190 [Rikenellaceae bacterium]
MQYIKFNEDGNAETTYVADGNISLTEVVTELGFIPCEYEERPSDDTLGLLESYELRYRNEGDHYVGYYGVVEVSAEKVEAEIVRLKGELADTDYQVTKNQELQMAGFACVYDPTELHTTRESIREAIRELEVYQE